LARVVAPVAALTKRSEQVAQRAVAQEVERLVGHLEGGRWLVGSLSAAAPLTPLALGLQVRRRGDVAFLTHALDDLLDQLFELGAHPVLIAVRRIAQQFLERLL